MKKVLAISYRPVNDLTPYEHNSRTHSERQVEQIAASINEFGFTQPILVDGKNGVIAGHGRLMAAKSIGMEKVPVIELSGLTAAQKRAYVIADNKLTENGGWDDGILAEELKALGAEGFDLTLTGFDDLKLEAFLAEKTEGLTDEDDVPDAPAQPVTVEGDVWVMGSHRIICGSSTDEETVSTVLAGVKPHLMVTDPPYGVEYDADWRNKAIRSGGSPIGGRATGKVMNDDRADWSDAWRLFPGAVAYVWHAARHTHTVAESLTASNFGLRSQIIWTKSNFSIGRSDYHWQHEPCWYAVRNGSKGFWSGDRKQTTVWQIPKPLKSETGHSTQKPVECMKRPIENNSSPGQAVYEPFSGSGTTIIASEMTGRHCYAVELNPVYVDVAVSRWQAFTGRSATLEGDGRTFDEIRAERIKDTA